MYLSYDEELVVIKCCWCHLCGFKSNLVERDILGRELSIQRLSNTVTSNKKSL